MFFIFLPDFSEKVPSHLSKLLDCVIDCCKKEEWEIAEVFAKRALKELENAVGSDNRDVGLLLVIVGTISKVLEQWDDAANAWKRAIEIFERDGSIKDDERSKSLVFRVLSDLADLLVRRHKYVEAEVFCKKAIEIREKSNYPVLSVTSKNEDLAIICLYLKKNNEAKKLLLAALRMERRERGINFFPHTIAWKLEAAFFWKNDYSESRISFINANEIGDAEALCSLGILFETEKFPEEAVDYYERAVNIYESKYGLNHPQVADVRSKLGRCFCKIGNVPESRHNFFRSLNIYKSTLPDDHPAILNIRCHLASCHAKLGSLTDATKTFEGILENVVTEENVPILKIANEYERNEDDRISADKDKYDKIQIALKNLSALYFLQGKCGAAQILQDFEESKYNSSEDDDI